MYYTVLYLNLLTLLAGARALFWMPGPGGEGRNVPAAHNSKTVHGIGIKFGRVVENRKLINLVQFNWQMTSLLCDTDVITVEILDFYKILPIKIRKVRRRS